MEPKRKAETSAQSTEGSKKIKVEMEVMEEEKEEVMEEKEEVMEEKEEVMEVKEEAIQASDRVQRTIQVLKSATGKRGKAKIDSLCSLSTSAGYEVLEDYDCMLNQTNIGHNNNKFYIIQLLHCPESKPPKYSTWCRWGRVGKVGQSNVSYFSDVASAKKDFEKKFKEKTNNSWPERENFTAHPRKYTMIEVEHDYDEEETREAMVKVDTVDGVSKKVKPCSLDKPTQDLMSLIFSSDMFNDAMKTMDLDIKKMPLGKLSKGQIAKGFDALKELQAALDRKAKKPELSDLSSRFYTIIPHNFGRQTPPIIDSLEVLQDKDMLLVPGFIFIYRELVLADIALAQTLQADKVKQEKESKLEEVPHPLDVDYQLLKCQLNLLDPKCEEYKVIDKYVQNTGPTDKKLKILNVWRVDRDKEEERLKEHKDIENQRLLRHGANVALVAAILKSGLHIMPHSGGSVRRGIYFASENRTSTEYVVCTLKSLGIMFLNEVALGKAPAGYDSVVARGITEPDDIFVDPKLDQEVILDGQKIIASQGPPTPTPKVKDPSCNQSEYLVNKESQARVRYLLLLEF